MYAHFSPSARETASVFAAFGDDSEVDTRMAQYLIGFDTFSQIATNRGATNYLIRSARLTVVGTGANTFQYDPTPDAYSTYFETNEPGYQPDTDPGRPVELFGAGFRNGFTSETFLQTSPAGGSAPGTRNVFAASYSTNGLLVDAGNNVGKTNSAFPRFEVYPFAAGQTTNANPGEIVPGGSRFTFDLNLSDPLVRQYLQESLDAGRLRLVISSLHYAELGGDTTYPAFNTHFSAFGNGPVLELDGTVIGATDSDNDELPDDWEKFFFDGSIAENAEVDSDQDGQPNLAEFRAGTNPNNDADKLRISSIQAGASSGMTVQFPFAASHSYAIEYSSDLSQWISVENPTLTYYSAPGVVQWRDDGSQTGGLGTNRFYRIRAR